MKNVSKSIVYKSGYDGLKFKLLYRRVVNHQLATNLDGPLPKRYNRATFLRITLRNTLEF